MRCLSGRDGFILLEARLTIARAWRQLRCLAEFGDGSVSLISHTLLTGFDQQ